MMKKMNGMIGVGTFLAVGMMCGMDDKPERSRALVSVQASQDASLSAVCLVEIKKTYSSLVEQRAQLLHAEEAYRKPLMEAQSDTIESDDELFEEAKDCYEDLSAYIDKIECKFATADLASIAVSELVSQQVSTQNGFVQTAVLAMSNGDVLKRADLQEIQDLLLPHINLHEVMLAQLKAGILIERMSSSNAAENKVAALTVKLEELDTNIAAKREELNELCVKTVTDLDESIATKTADLQRLEASCAVHTSRPYVVGVGSAVVGASIGALAYKWFSSK